MKKIVSLLLMSFLFFNCKQATDKNSFTEDVQIDTSAVSVIDTSGVSKDVNGWEYETQTDKMTSNKDEYCSLRSNESLNLGAPYDGINYGTLTVRRKSGDVDIIISIQQGQISGGYENEYFKARFDDGKQMTFSYLNPSDNSTETIFVENTSKFLKKLKASKKTLIQIPLYQNGSQILEFNTEGLKF